MIYIPHVAPTDVYAQVNLLNYLTVSWTPPADLTGVTGYMIQYTAGGVEATEVIGDPAVTTATFQNNNLANPLGSVFIVPTAGANIDPNNIVEAVTPPPANGKVCVKI